MAENQAQPTAKPITETFGGRRCRKTVTKPALVAAKRTTGLSDALRCIGMAENHAQPTAKPITEVFGERRCRKTAAKQG